MFSWAGVGMRPCGIGCAGPLNRGPRDAYFAVGGCASADVVLEGRRIRSPARRLEPPKGES